jgi:hypothetical protein
MIPNFNNTTYKWDIINLEVIKHEASENNVIKQVDWTYIGSCITGAQLVDGEGLVNVVTTASLSGNTTLGPPNPETFIQFSDIQKANVVTWLEASMNVEPMQANIKSQIMSIVLPPIPPTFNVTPSWGND